jgi:hypothetical protein
MISILLTAFGLILILSMVFDKTIVYMLTTQRMKQQARLIEAQNKQKELEK